MKSGGEAVRSFLGRHRRRYVVAGVLNGLAGGIGVVAWFVALAAGLFVLFPWVGLPFIADTALAALLVYALWVLIWRGVLRRPTLLETARMLERRCGRPHQTLVVAHELSTGRGSRGSASLIARLFDNAVEALGTYSHRSLVPIGRARAASAGLGLAAAAALMALPNPPLLSYLHIPFTLLSEVRAEVEPGSIAVARNASVKLRCIPERSDFPSARLVVSPPGTPGGTRVLLRPDSQGVFAYATGPLSSSREYRFFLGGAEFGPETVTVVEPPELYSLNVTLTPPRYTGRPVAELREGQGTIAAYAGTRAAFSVGSAYPLAEAAYVPEKGKPVPLTIENGRAEGAVRLWRSGSYTFELVDSLGQRSDSLPSFLIDILPDYPPSVRIIKPGMNRVLTTAQRETLWVEGVDDLGLRRMALHWRKSGGEEGGTDSLDLFPRGKRPAVLRREYVWELTDQSLYPGDTVFYWATVRDNKPFGDPQVAVSDTFWFRVPSIREIHEEIARKESYAERTVDAVREHHESMQQKLERFVRAAKGKEELSWEEKKIVEDFGKSMKAQGDSLRKAVEALRESVEKMKEEGVLTDELGEKMEEVRRALEELIEEYGDSLFFEPPKPDEAVSWDDIRESVDKMKELLPNLEQRLEQARRYLEAIKRDQKLASMAAKAEKLADRQLGLTMSEDGKRLERQKALARDVEQLMEELEEAMRSKEPDLGLSARDMPAMEEAAERLKGMEGELEAGRMPDAGLMSRMSGSMQSLAQQLRSKLSSAMMAQYMKEREQLLDMAGDALDLARWQKDLGESVHQSEQQALAAAAQQGIRDALKKNMEKLDSLTATPPMMLQDIVKNMDAAMASMEGVLSAMGQGARPGGTMGQATSRLNSLANSLMRSADAMQQCSGNCQGGGGGGMMAGLRKLSGKQAAVNALTSEMLKQMLEGGREGSQPGGTGEGGDPRQMAEAREAARRAQQEIADELERLAEQYGDEAGGGGKRMRELEEEARRLARMLEKPTPEVGDRQDRFLVRMLQSTLSVHRQNEGKEERKSTAARTVYSESVPAPSGEVFRDTDTFYNLRSRALEGNYPESYRPAVQAYFDSLGTLFLREQGAGTPE